MQRSVIIACVYLSCAYVPVHAIDLAIGTEVLSCMCYHCNNSLKPSYSILIHMHTHTKCTRFSSNSNSTTERWFSVTNYLKLESLLLPFQIDAPVVTRAKGIFALCNAFAAGLCTSVFIRAKGMLVICGCFSAGS